MAGMYPELYDIVSVDGRPFNTRTGRAPELIFVPRNEHEIEHIFREAKKHKKLVVPRCGGHSYAAYGLGGINGTWVIDLQRFDKVDIDVHGEYAFVGAGNRLGRVALQLYDRARRAMPHGLCPRVGISGHALHGGFGFSSRNWGLALDAIDGVHVILPDGRKIWASREVEPELFWCMLGAGSSFGIVTEFKIRLQRAPEHCIHYWYTWNPQAGGLPSKETLIKVHHEFQEFANSTGADAVPKELTVRMRIIRDYMEMTGAYWGTRENFDRAMAPLLKRWSDAGVPPDDATVYHKNGVPSSGVRARTWREMLLYMANDDHLESLERLGTSVLDPADYKFFFLQNSLEEALGSMKLSGPDTTKSTVEDRLDQIQSDCNNVVQGEGPDDNTRARSEAIGRFCFEYKKALGQNQAGLASNYAQARTFSASGGGGGGAGGPDFPTAQLFRDAKVGLTDEFFATSLCIKDKIESQKLFEFIDKYRAGNQDPKEPKGYYWFLLMDFYGGEKSMITNGHNKDVSCYANRTDMFTFQFYINIDKTYPEPDQRPSWKDAIRWLHDMRDQVVKNTDPAFKVYMCYIDPEDRQEGSDRPISGLHYYGPDNYKRLLDAKKKYDPEHRLWNPQSIGAEELEGGGPPQFT